jgi:hypothetical protein
MRRPWPTGGGGCHAKNKQTIKTQRKVFSSLSLALKRRIKSQLPFAGIIRSSPYSPRWQDKCKCRQTLCATTLTIIVSCLYLSSRLRFLLYRLADINGQNSLSASNPRYCDSASDKISYPGLDRHIYSPIIFPVQSNGKCGLAIRLVFWE